MTTGNISIYKDKDLGWQISASNNAGDICSFSTDLQIILDLREDLIRALEDLRPDERLGPIP